jgi:histidyl-tRNA synthetase
MAAVSFQSLPGFRDFLPRDFAVRQYLHETWRATARRHGFVEYETPLLEDTELYLKKSGGELSSQLFRFDDQGGRNVTLRPEVTASLARLAAQHQRDFPKPLKWFEIGQCFRYEKPQKGRGREFFQWNVDVLGEDAVQADGELLAVAIAGMLALGFGEGDFRVRVSDRKAWADFAAQRGVEGAALADFLQVVDKLEREREEVLEAKLGALGLDLAGVRAFIADEENASAMYRALHADLCARGLGSYLEWDLSIVRGLAYYTGMVFEVFDARGEMRAVAGGGRYDSLIATMSGGKVDLPATGFAMGDYVIRNLIEETPHAMKRMEEWLARNAAGCEIYALVDGEEQRAVTLGLVTRLREAGLRVDFPLTAMKYAKQMQRAEQSGARLAVVAGEAAEELRVKCFAPRSERTIALADAVVVLKEMLASSDGLLVE